MMVLLKSAIWLLIISYGLAEGSDVLYVQHAPSYYQISTDGVGETPLKTSQLSDVISAALGFSIYDDFHWNGLKSRTFFERPKAAVVVEFIGFENVSSNIANNKFSLTPDQEASSAYSEVANRISARFSNQQLLSLGVTNDNNFYSVMAEYPDILNDVDPDPEKMEFKLRSKQSAFATQPFKSLNLSTNVDKEFLIELQLFVDVINALLANEEKVHRFKASDFLWIQSLAFKNLKETYGVNSPQVPEALTAIKTVLKNIESGMVKLYGDNYLMLVLAIDLHNEVPKSRLGRSLLQEMVNVNASTINLSPSYDQDYPAMFNILLFISLLLSLTVFAIALGMWHIDPGRDSIIYRMTSQRMKKDQ